MWVNTKAKMNQAFKLYFSIGFITPSGMGTCWSMWVCMQPCIGCCLYTWEHSSDCVHWCCCSYRSSAWALGCSSSSSYLMVVAYGTNLLLSTSAMLTPTLTLLAFTLNELLKLMEGRGLLRSHWNCYLKTLLVFITTVTKTHTSLHRFWITVELESKNELQLFAIISIFLTKKEKWFSLFWTVPWCISKTWSQRKARLH